MELLCGSGLAWATNNRKLLANWMFFVMAKNSHQGYRVSIEPAAGHLQVMVGAETIAESHDALVMNETRQLPVVYFPREDVRMGWLTKNSQTTHCPFKGDASYFDLKLGKEKVSSLAWSYEDGYDEAALVSGHIAFDGAKVSGFYRDGEPLAEPAVSLDLDTAVNPLVHWLVTTAWQARTIPETLEAMARALRDSGLQLWRLRLFVRTLNPQLYGKFYTWQMNLPSVDEAQATHKGMLSEQHLNSPYATIINGEGGIRRCLEGDEPLLDYPILHDLIEEGATDYVALPMRFSDGQINILTLVSNEPGGFTTSQLGYLYEVLPNVGRLIEAHAQRDSALTLLQTYLGRNAGQRVLSGKVQRGDGEDLDTIIWFSDLRDSTRMADSMDRMTYLKGLDQYFDCVAGAIVQSGGEVLKFIGDAILAIFPTNVGFEEACAQAVSAIRQANDGLAQVNAQREVEGLRALRFGTGLHRGNILYGNIGAESRLDFTVIGPAVNEASRIEGLCKQLGESVLTSAAFADGLQAGKRSLGEFELSGVKNRWELFRLDL
jgi:class 3 adenylate cyclase/uncharacterized protein (DUF427 family)